MDNIFQTVYIPDDDHRRSGFLSIDFNDIIRENRELHVIAKCYIVTIIPIIKSDFGATVRSLCSLLSALENIDRGLNERRMNNERVLHKAVADTISSVLQRLKNCTCDFQSVPLEETNNLLNLQIAKISILQGSIKWRRSLCTNAVIVVVFLMLSFSIWFASIRAAPVASVAASAVATGIKELGRLAYMALDKKEQKLKQQKKVIKTMKRGQLLMTYEYNLVQQQMKVCLEERMSESSALMRYDERENEGTMEIEIIRNMMNNIHELKSKIKLYLCSIYRFETNFIRIITNS